MSIILINITILNEFGKYMLPFRTCTLGYVYMNKSNVHYEIDWRF
jgi:hypothetical protein